MVTLLRMRNWLQDHITRSSHFPEGVRAGANEVVFSIENGTLWSSSSLKWNTKTLIINGSVLVNSTTPSAFGMQVNDTFNANRISVDGAALADSSGSTLLQLGDIGNNFDRFSLYENGGEIITLKNGKVGVGIIDPQRNLDVLTGDTAITGLGIADSTGSNRLNIFATSNRGIIYSGATGNVPLVLNNGSNVGIGWNSPSAMMDANGVIRVRGIDWAHPTATGSTTCTLGTNSPSTETTPTTWIRQTIYRTNNDMTVVYIPAFA